MGGEPQPMPCRGCAHVLVSANTTYRCLAGSRLRGLCSDADDRISAAARSAGTTGYSCAITGRPQFTGNRRCRCNVGPRYEGIEMGKSRTAALARPPGVDGPSSTATDTHNADDGARTPACLTSPDRRDFGIIHL